jgi:hypothetical protein
MATQKKKAQSGPWEIYLDDCSQQNQISLDIALFFTYSRTMTEIL